MKLFKTNDKNLSSSLKKTAFKRLSAPEQNTQSLSPVLTRKKNLSNSPPFNTKNDISYKEFIHTVPNPSQILSASSNKNFKQSKSTEKLPVLNKYEIKVEMEHFAEGSFSSIYIGKLIYKECNIAVKVFNKTVKLSTKKDILSPINSYDADENFVHEWRISTILPKCENIVEFYGATKLKGYPALVFELCEDGNLSEYLKANAKKITKLECIDILMGISKGLNRIHSNNPSLVHNDLSSRNIVISIQNNKIIPKICDFGSSRFSGQSNRMIHQLTTEEYTPPEVWKNKSNSNTTYIDIYSFGIIISEIAISFAVKKYYLPFGYENENRDRWKIIDTIETGNKPNVPKNIDLLFEKTMDDCLNENSKKRPSANILLKEFECAKNSEKEKILFILAREYSDPEQSLFGKDYLPWDIFNLLLNLF